jgi:glycosyltransferase involved in cell wall biosynthesis
MCCGQPVQKATISCAMIVRDAEATLETALNSIARYVDEIVIVDTGSVDQTKKIAERFTENVYSYQWSDDFGQARQHAHDLCSSEWVFFLDADDEVFGAELLRAVINAAPDHMDAYMLRYVTERNAQGKAVTEFYRERVVRKDRMRWAGRVHEVMVPVDGHCAYERFDGCWVLHHGHGDGSASLLRNIGLLQLDLFDHPDDTRTQFYLGRDLVQVGQLAEGMALLETYQAASTWADERFFAITLIGHSLRVQGNFYDAYVSDLRLLLVQPLWPQAWYALAQDCYFLKLWPECVHYSEVGQGLPAPATNLFQAPIELESGWMIFATVALYRCGRVIEAAELTIRALTLRPDDLQHQANAVFFKQQMELHMHDKVAVGTA